MAPAAPAGGSGPPFDSAPGYQTNSPGGEDELPGGCFPRPGWAMKGGDGREGTVGVWVPYSASPGPHPLSRSPTPHPSRPLCPPPGPFLPSLQGAGCPLLRRFWGPFGAGWIHRAALRREGLKAARAGGGQQGAAGKDWAAPSPSRQGQQGFVPGGVRGCQRARAQKG